MSRMFFCCLLLLSTLASLACPLPKAYYCASGYLVKYHASPTCWGLRACNAAVKPISLAQARRQRLAPCRVRH